MKKYNTYDLLKVYSSEQTVFTIKELCLLWEVNKPELVWARVSDYVKANKLYKIRKGIVARDKNYDKFELATKIYTPSYISFETVLSKHGIIFQHYDTIFIVSYLTREIEVNGYKIRIRKINNNILLNSSGIINEKNYFIATKERAFLDVLYLYKEYYFDNLDLIDKNKVLELAKIYNSKKLIERVREYFID